MTLLPKSQLTGAHRLLLGHTVIYRAELMTQRHGPRTGSEEQSTAGRPTGGLRVKVAQGC
uniref:Uncharacterized protein n=1 Tax=Anguilla anguilla TaxID=7936 RepID=A0A0E9XT98_ANGAN